jgi:hypothetical protein
MAHRKQMRLISERNSKCVWSYDAIDHVSTGIMLCSQGTGVYMHHATRAVHKLITVPAPCEALPPKWTAFLPLIRDVPG